MGVNDSKLGDFGRLTHDLRAPKFIKKYLAGPDFKLLLAAYGVKMINHNDVLYYFKHYPMRNLELHKYYDIQKYVDDIHVEDDWELIKFHHINGATLNVDVSIYVIYKIEAVRYLHENGCDINLIALRDSIIYNDMTIIQYLHDNGYKYNRTSFTAMLSSRRYRLIDGSFSIISYKYDPVAMFLFENVELSNYDGIFMMALIYCDYFIVKYMLDEGYVELDFDYSCILKGNRYGARELHMNHLKKYHGIDTEKFLELL